MKHAPGDEVWGFGDSEHAEEWNTGGATRDEAILSARACYGDNESFFVVCGEYQDAVNFIPSAADILSQMGDLAGDNGCPDGSDFPDVSREAEAELDTLLKEWTRKSVTADFWVAISDAELVPALVESPPAAKSVRAPYLRDPRMENNLPGQVTCGDCAHFTRCEFLISANPLDERCDWVPIRFVAKAPVGP